ncbi:MAG: bacillithiol biosynthesis deacetylase BshB1 [Salibacteraceae bacterium]
MKEITPVDVLAIGAHPDDVELGCSGTLIKSIQQGLKVGICDLTRGELGTRGSAPLRLQEAEEARKIIGAEFRVNLSMADGFFEVSEQNKRLIIEVIRAAKPKIVFLNAPSDRHPDHGRGAQLQKDACFLSGLRKVETVVDGKVQEPFRPTLMVHYIQDRLLEPSFIVDITKQWDKKMEAILAFSSQFYNPDSNEPPSAISSKEFIDLQEGRALHMGRLIQTRYGEGFVTERPIGINGLSDLL